VDAKLSALTEAHETWLREQLEAVKAFVADYGSNGPRG